jgi:hypothetical protein
LARSSSAGTSENHNSAFSRVHGTGLGRAANCLHSAPGELLGITLSNL